MAWWKLYGVRPDVQPYLQAVGDTLRAITKQSRSVSGTCRVDCLPKQLQPALEMFRRKTKPEMRRLRFAEIGPGAHRD